MRVFVTGATGFIGAAVVAELIRSGHQVIGLARSDAAALKLSAVGAEVHRGSLDDPESLRQGAAKAEGVIHLAFIHGPGGMTLRQKLWIFFGGLPTTLVSRFLSVSCEAERRAIEAIGAELEGSHRPFVVTFGTMGLVPGGRKTEADEPDPRSPGYARAVLEKSVLALAGRGVRASVVRLPPSVHGDGDKGLVPQLAGIARKKKVAAYVGTGDNRWSAVHVRDAAALFRLVLESGRAGGRYHAVADEGVPFRDIAAVIGKRLDLPVVSWSKTQAKRDFSWFGPFVAADNPATSDLTRQELGWHPKEIGLLADLDRAQYFATSP